MKPWSDKGLLLSLDNTVIEYGHDEELWSSSMPLVHSQPLMYGAGEREAWRDNLVQALFAGLLKPLWQTFNRVSGVSRRISWENSAVRVYWRPRGSQSVDRCGRGSGAAGRPGHW